VNGIIILRGVFFVWLLSLSTMFSRFIHTIALLVLSSFVAK
jgi:hypothetical protein